MSSDLPASLLKLRCQKCMIDFRNLARVEKHYGENPGCRPVAKHRPKCRLCEKAFHDERTLKRHVNHIHKGIERPRNHHCDICFESFELKRMLDNHLEFCRSKFKCLTCKEFFPSSWFLKRHVDFVHEGKRDHRCHDCHKSFATSGALNIHQSNLNCERDCVDEGCDFCHPERQSPSSSSGVAPPEFIPEEAIENEISEILDNPLPPSKGLSLYTCKLHHKNFSTEEKVREHINWIHHGIKVKICPTCKKGFASIPCLKIHFTKSPDCKRPSTFKKEKIHECPLCSKTFIEAPRLDHHVKLYHASIKCKDCDKSFQRRGEYDAHMAKHKSTNQIEVKDEPMEDPLSLSPKHESDPLAIANENDSGTEDQEEVKSVTPSKEQKCPECGEVVKNLKTHARKHLSSSSCNICGKTFKERYMVTKHIKLVHEKAGHEECPVCHKQFSSLKKHINDVHLRRSRVKCEICNKEFCTKQNLKKHTRNVHNQ